MGKLTEKVMNGIRKVAPLALAGLAATAPLYAQSALKPTPKFEGNAERYIGEAVDVFYGDRVNKLINEYGSSNGTSTISIAYNFVDSVDRTKHPEWKERFNEFVKIVEDSKGNVSENKSYNLLYDAEAQVYKGQNSPLKE